MSEAEILSIRNELTGLVVSVGSVSFGMVSAYIAGLWLCFKVTPISLRLLRGYTLYEASVFLGSLAFGAIYVSLAYLTFFYKWPGATAGPVRISP